MDKLAVEAKADTKARRQVLDQLAPMVGYFAKRRAGRIVEFDDLRQLGLMGVDHAIDRYDPALGSFRAYAKQWARGYMANKGYRRVSRIRDNELSGMMEFEYDGHCPWAQSEPINFEARDRVRKLHQGLSTDYERAIVEGMLRQESYVEIADSLGISKQRVHQILHDIKAKAPKIWK